ncbi:MAG: hypothetical protein V1787_01770 [Candidatus Micrarchaeota archaeon]
MDVLKNHFNATDAVLTVALVAIVALYAVTKHPLLGIAGLAALLALLARDLFTSKKREYKESVEFLGARMRIRTLLAGSALLSLAVAYFSSDIIQLFSLLLFALNGGTLAARQLKLAGDSLASSVAELDTAFFAALFAWLTLGFLLNTPTPLDVVTSCSMVPNLDRGDLIILHGGSINAPVAELTQPLTSSDFIKDLCVVRDTKSGAEFNTLCTTGVRAGGSQYSFGKTSDIIVYSPLSRPDIGLIVHRAVLKLNYDGKTYYLTKGDNNPVTDIEGIITSPPEEGQVMGKVIARLPYVGYLKLFLAFQFEEPAACRRVIQPQAIN